MTEIARTALALFALSAAAPALAVTPTEIVQRHTASGGNIEAIMADYADDAVVLQSGRALQGKPEIRKFFAAMVGPRPAGAGGAPAGGPPAMKITKVWEEGNVGFMTWEMGPMHVTEEFIVKDGKIAVQAIFMGGGMGGGGMGGGMGPGGAPRPPAP